MKRFMIVVVLALAAWQGYGEYKTRRAETAEPQGIADVAQPEAPTTAQLEVAPTSQYRCDGRTRCSQMTSCEEATFFLRNCPGVTMDGNNDGVPCEQQWCRP
jgi:Excalibur calcium-binding domain